MSAAPAPRKRLTAAALAACLLAGCPHSPAEVVDGPEAGDLAARLSGTLLARQGRDTTDNDPRVLALSLPELRRTIVRKYTGADRSLAYTGWIETVSGPDREGRIAFVEEAAFQSKDYAVKTIRLDGGDEQTLFRVHGKGLRDSLSLSPAGERIAYVGEVTDLQMPGALLETGRLVVWDRSQGTAAPFGASVLVHPPSWFPDGRRLALTELVPRRALASEIEAGLREDPGYLGGVEKWERLPAIYLLDLQTGDKRFVQVGWRPLVSLDGRSVLFRWGGYRLLDLATGVSRRVRWPGGSGTPIALLPGDLLIYPGLPTRGSKIRRIRYGSFSVGSALGSIKVAELGTQRFQTLLEYAEPRERFSFGRFTVKEHHGTPP